MSIEQQLFEGELTRLASPDPEHDAEIESKWAHAPDYMRLISLDPIRPLSPPQIRKKYEAIEKDGEKQFYFAVRARAGDRLLGFVRLDQINWTQGTARLTMGIGSPKDWGQGFGRDGLRLILRYAFDELNLYRVGASTFAYNERGIRFLQRAGFAVEARQRQAINRDGQRWDAVWLGILKDEWKKQTR